MTTMTTGLWLFPAALMAVWGLTAWFTTPRHGRAVWVGIGLLALCVRFVATWFILGNHGDSAGTDGLLYHKVALDVMVQLRQGIPLWRVEHAYTLYTLVLGVQYAVLGPNRYLGCFMNAAWAVAGGHALMHLGRGLGFSDRKAITVAGLWLFLPSLVVWTSDTRKEGISLMLAMWLWWMALRLFQGGSPRAGANSNVACKRLNHSEGNVLPGVVPIVMMIAVCLMLWVSTLLRLYMLFPLGGGLLAGLAIRWAQTRRQAVAVFFVLVLLTSCLSGAISLMPRMGDSHALKLERTEGGDEDMSAEYMSLLERLFERDLPKAVNGFFTEPHPRHIGEISDLQGQDFASAAVLAEMLLWYGLMFISLFGMMEATLRGRAFLLGMIVFILLYSGVNILIAEDISDTYYRYRAFILAPVMLFADPRPAFRLMRKGRQASPFPPAP